MRGRRPSSAPAPPAGPPVFVPGRLYGLRQWTPSRGEDGAILLGGRYVDDQWRAGGESTWARCRPGVPHPAGEKAPAAACTCGLHAWHPWAIARQPSWSIKGPIGAVLNGPLRIVGIVEGWGKVHIHREGFRAEYARPVLLLRIGVPRDSDYGRLLDDLAIAYRAGVLEVEGSTGVQDYCRVNEIGMSETTVQALITRRDPGPLRADG
jgi:hypothetical protein